jgi:hypothetical protein
MTDQVCSSLDKVCEPKCTADTDCAVGRTCDTATGQCNAGNTGTCSPACSTGYVCDTSTSTCVPENASCSGEGQSTCAYGQQYCSSGTCTALPAPTCDNYTNFSNKSALGTTGTIIYSARVVSAATDTNWCGTSGSTPKRVKIALSAYSSTPFPQTKDELGGFFYVRVNGTTLDGPGTVSASSGNYTVTGTNRENAEIIVNLCVDSASTTSSTGIYFTSGNFYCYQASYL